MSRRILLLVHLDLVPPEDLTSEPDRFECPFVTEYDVKKALQELGHEVMVLGILDDINILTQTIETFKPHCVFNLLEEFNSDTRSDFKVIALLEMLQLKYSGCNSKGLLLARDKALSKKILSHHKIATPNFITFPKNKKKKIPKNMQYPAIVKCLFEEASYGIAQASIVSSEAKLKERIEYITKKLDQDAIVEEFIAGQEIYMGVIGEKQLTTLPAWELKFENAQEPDKEIYSSRAKWNQAYRKRKGINTGPANISKQLEEQIIKVCKRTYQVLNLSGYARIDMRVTETGKVYVLEANPNPNIAWDDEFAKSALHQKIKYTDLIQQLLPS